MSAGRFTPCSRCGLAPYRHNPLNPANYVGHEYETGPTPHPKKPTARVCSHPVRLWLPA